MAFNTCLTARQFHSPLQPGRKSLLYRHSDTGDDLNSGGDSLPPVAR